MASNASELSLLPLKPGDHLWKVDSGGFLHAVYVGPFILSPEGDGSEVSIFTSSSSPCIPQSVVVVLGACVSRVPLTEFAGRRSNASEDVHVRLYTRRPRGRREAVARALRLVGTSVDSTSLSQFPEMLPWFVIFDEANNLQPGLSATRAKSVRYRLVPKGDEPVQHKLMQAVLAGGAVVQRGRIVLKGVKLMKVLRLTRTAGASWASLGGFVGQSIANNILDDGDSRTSVATAAGGWVGSIAGGGAAAAAAATVGVESLGAGSVLGGLVLCSSMSAAGAFTGACLAYAGSKMVVPQAQKTDRTAEYHDCCLRLLGDANDVFNLFDAILEFPPEDLGFGEKAPVEEPMPSPDAHASESDEDEEGDQTCSRAAGCHVNPERLAVAGWYAVRVQPDGSNRFEKPP